MPQNDEPTAVGRFWYAVAPASNRYLLRRTKQRLNFSATVAAVRSVHALFPDAVAVLIEDKANGPP